MIPHPLTTQAPQPVGPLTDAHFSAFLADIAHLPATTIVGQAVSMDYCVTAQWYRANVHAPIAVSILRQYVNLDAQEGRTWQDTPHWVRCIEGACDYCYQHKQIPEYFTQAHLMTIILPSAQQTWGLQVEVQA